MNSRILYIVFICYGIHFILDDIFFKSLRGYIYEYLPNMGISHIISYLVFGIPLFIGVFMLGKYKEFFKHLGLDSSLIQGLIFSIVCVAPMFIGFFFLFPINSTLSLNEFLISGVAAAFFEELYFRGFLFGIVFKFTRLGFILAVISGALLFALIHLYQSQDIATLVGIFLTTFIGAIIFAWVYVEWRFNIWIPIGLHFFMNLAWMVFSVSDNALGDVYANVYRFISIVLIFALTIIYKKQKRLPFYITKRTIWLKRIRFNLEY